MQWAASREQTSATKRLADASETSCPPCATRRMSAFMESRVAPLPKNILSDRSFGRVLVLHGQSRHNTLRDQYLPDLKGATQGLFPLNCFEEGFEVALAEALRSFAVDDLVKEGRAVCDWLGENLKEITFVISIH